MNKDKTATAIPKSFQGILWSCSVDKLEPERDKIYIINQVLSYGNLEQLRWLFKIYGKDTVKSVFLSHPQNIYTSAGVYFIQDILDLGDVPLKKSQYVKNIFGSPNRGGKKGIS